MLIAYTILFNIMCVYVMEYIATEQEQLSKKKIGYYIVMFGMNILLAALLNHIYAETSILSHMKRMAIVTLLWIITPYDFTKHIIPNKAIGIGLCMRGVILIAEILFERKKMIMTLASEIIIIVAIFVVAGICMLIMKGSIGGGDVKLLMLMGAFQGIEGAFGSVMLSLIILFISAVFCLLTHKKERKDALPFAPYALVGTYLSVLLTGV